MLKINKDQKRLPVGGHHYPEYGKTFKGETVDELVKQVKAFRLANNIPAGNPEQEILMFYAKNWPFMVKEDREAKETVSDKDYTAWRQWIYDTWSHPPKKLITSKEAKERWDVCLSCPMMKRPAWKSTDESSELTRRAFVLRRGVETGVNNNFCSCHQVDLGVFVFLENQEKRQDQPVGCWV